jgi:hypothetical protein
VFTVADAEISVLKKEDCQKKENVLDLSRRQNTTKRARKMKPVLLFLILSFNAVADDMDILRSLAKHWLEKSIPTEANTHSIRILCPTKFYPDGSWVRIYTPPKRNVNMREFAELSRNWKRKKSSP